LITDQFFYLKNPLQKNIFEKISKIFEKIFTLKIPYKMSNIFFEKIE